jgi:hypothetical protein
MSSKLERDIDEVLAKIERFPPKRSLRSRIRRRLANILGGAGEALASIPRPQMSIGQVLLLGIAVIIIAYVFRDFIGSSLVRIFIIGGILTFIGAFIFSLRRQSASRRPQKMWRGQPMDLDRPGGSEPWWKRWRSRR